jgi:hypothetical protein
MLGTDANPIELTTADPLVSWQGIRLNDSQGSANSWAYAIIDRAGSRNWSGADYSGAAVFLDGSSTLFMEGVDIQGSESHGLVALGGVDFTFNAGSFAGNQTPAYLHPEVADGLGAETVFVDNTNQYVRVAFNNTDSIDTEITWPLIEVPWRFENDVAISGRFVLPAGSLLEFAQDVRLLIREGGRMEAVGTAEQPIVFRGVAAGTRGFWKGIENRSTGDGVSTAEGLLLDYAYVEDAGSSQWSGNSESTASLYMEAQSSARVTNTTFTNSGRWAIWAGDDATFNEFGANTFTLGAFTMIVHPDRVGELDTASSYISNDDNRVHIGFNNTNRVSAPATWRYSGVPFVARDRMTIDAGLTIEGGVTVEFEQDVSWIVSDTGWLNTLGTETLPVAFRGSNALDTGYWQGIRFASNAAENALNHTTFEHAGSDLWTGDAESAATLYVGGDAAVHLENVTLGAGGGYGVFLEDTDSSLTCTGVSFTDPDSGAIWDDNNEVVVDSCG